MELFWGNLSCSKKNNNLGRTNFPDHDWELRSLSPEKEGVQPSGFIRCIFFINLIFFMPMSIHAYTKHPHAYKVDMNRLSKLAVVPSGY